MLASSAHHTAAFCVEHYRKALRKRILFFIVTKNLAITSPMVLIAEKDGSLLKASLFLKSGYMFRKCAMPSSFFLSDMLAFMSTVTFMLSCGTLPVMH